MFQKLFLFLSVSLLLVACQSDDTAVKEPKVTEITIAQFNADPESYVGQTLAMSGTVDHVCRHGGKKMFMVGEDPADRLKVEASTKVGSFAVELEGSDVAVQGIVKVFKMDETYLNEWETEVLAAGEGVDISEGEEGVGACAAERRVKDSDEGEEHAAAEAEGEEHVDADGEADEDQAVTNPALEEIASLRQELAESDKDYIGFYSIEGTSLAELNQ